MDTRSFDPPEPTPEDQVPPRSAIDAEDDSPPTVRLPRPLAEDAPASLESPRGFS